MSTTRSPKEIDFLLALISFFSEEGNKISSSDLLLGSELISEMILPLSLQGEEKHLAEHMSPEIYFGLKYGPLKERLALFLEKASQELKNLFRKEMTRLAYESDKRMALVETGVENLRKRKEITEAVRPSARNYYYYLVVPQAGSVLLEDAEYRERLSRGLRERFEERKMSYIEVSILPEYQGAKAIRGARKKHNPGQGLDLFLENTLRNLLGKETPMKIRSFNTMYTLLRDVEEKKSPRKVSKIHEANSLDGPFSWHLYEKSLEAFSRRIRPEGKNFQKKCPQL